METRTKVIAWKPLFLHTVNSEIIACIYYCDSSTADKNV